MKTKCLSALLTLGVVSLAFPVLASSSTSDPQLSFACEISEGVPATIAQSEASDARLPVFLWKSEALASKSGDSPEQLCNIVSEKLDSYSAEGYDLSSINFVGTEEGGLPVICANVGGTGCSKILLTLRKTAEPATVASDVVDAILAKNLQSKKTEVVARGVQSISYEINFLSLLFEGLRPKFWEK